jgi:ribosomal protein S18 acetylase RimI-like enzyme
MSNRKNVAYAVSEEAYEMIQYQEHEGIQYGICERSDLDEMVILLSDNFTRFDPPAVAAGISSKEFEEFIRIFLPNVASDGLTIIARTADTSETVGALLTDDAAVPPPAALESISGKFDPVLDILGRLGKEYWQAKELEPGEYLHLFLLGVARPFTGRGIARQLVRVCLKNGVQKGFRVGVTEATNDISQHIFRQQGFVERVSRSYQDFRYEGNAVFASIKEHAGPMLMDKDLL